RKAVEVKMADTKEVVPQRLPDWQWRRKRGRKAVEAKAKLKMCSANELSLETQQEREAKQARELINREKSEFERAKAHNQPWLDELKQIGQHHANMKRMHMAAEFWAKQNRIIGTDYHPLQRFDREMKDMIGEDE